MPRRASSSTQRQNGLEARHVGEHRRRAARGRVQRRLHRAEDEDRHLVADDVVPRAVVAATATADHAAAGQLLDPAAERARGRDVRELRGRAARRRHVAGAFLGHEHEDGHLLARGVRGRAVGGRGAAAGDAVVQQGLDEAVEGARRGHVGEAAADVQPPQLVLALGVGRDRLHRRRVHVRGRPRGRVVDRHRVAVGAGGDGAVGDGAVGRRRVGDRVREAGRAAEGAQRAAERLRGAVDVAPRGQDGRRLAGIEHAVARGVHVQGGGTQAAEALHEDAVAAAVQGPVHPRGEDVPDVVGGHRGLVLDPRGGGVDRGLGVARSAGGGEAAAADVRGGGDALAVPVHDEVAAAVDADAVRVVHVGRIGVDLELRADRGAGGREPAGDHLPRLRPAHDEGLVRRRAHHRGLLLDGRRVAGDQELAADADAVGVIALPGDVVVVGAVLRRPHHDEAAVVVHGHGRVDLVAEGHGVDLELAALADAVGVEALAVHARPAAVLVGVVAAPHHHEVAVGGHGDAVVLLEEVEGRALAALAEGVHRELASAERAIGVEALGEHAVRVAVLVVAAPGHHEVPLGVAGQHRAELVARGEGVDAELRALGRSGDVVALGEDPVRRRVERRVLARPRHHEVAVGLDVDVRAPLDPGDVAVRAELGAGANLLRASRRRDRSRDRDRHR